MTNDELSAIRTPTMAFGLTVAMYGEDGGILVLPMVNSSTDDRLKDITLQCVKVCHDALIKHFRELEIK